MKSDRRIYPQKRDDIPMIPRPRRKADSEINICDKCPYEFTHDKNNWKKIKHLLDEELIKMVEESKSGEELRINYTKAYCYKFFFQREEQQKCK